jgi:hypothetical protein
MCNKKGATISSSSSSLSNLKKHVVRVHPEQSEDFER